MIGTIFKKELLDTLRDKRTLMTMIIIPVMVFPVIMTLFLKVSESFSENAATKTVNIGVVAGSDGENFVNTLKSLPKEYGKRNVIMLGDTTNMKQLIRMDSLQFGVFVPVDFEKTLQEKKSAKMEVFYNATELGMKDRAEAYLNTISELEKQKRYQELNIQIEEITPLYFEYKNVATDKETIGKLIGGFLPYLFIVFGFVGCMYPAIDLFTGEKERGTLETLLTTPVSRLQILIGKMGVIVLSGLMAVTFTLVGIFLSIKVFNMVEDPRILEVIYQILSAKFLVMMYLLIIPMIIFFAGVMIPIAVYAKSFKEAQSIITPMNMFFILPAMVGFFPGISLNFVTAFIPVVNIVLATKDLIAGTLDYKLLIISFLVMTTLAAIAVTISYKRFDKESNLVS